jgi:DNA polymerase-3 subunit delta
MKCQELEASLRHASPASVYLVLGEDDCLRDSAVATIKGAVLGDGAGGGFNDDVFYGDEVAAADVIACASEIPVFSARRLVTLKSAEKVSAREGDTFLSYLASPNDSTTLCFVASKLDGRLKFTQRLSQAAVTVDCSPLKGLQLTTWVHEEGKRLGVGLDEQAVTTLKDGSGESLYCLRREIEKLAAYLPAGHIAQAADVELLRGTEPGASVFDLTHAIAARDRGRTLWILARNLEAGEAPLRILGALAWQYRRLWKVKDLVRQGGREGEAARTLRMDPARVRSFLGAFTDSHLQEAFRQFLGTDAKLKGGSGGSGVRILESLLLALCARPRDIATPPAPADRAIRLSGAKPVSNVRTVRSVKR